MRVSGLSGFLFCLCSFLIRFRRSHYSRFYDSLRLSVFYSLLPVCLSFRAVYLSIPSGLSSFPGFSLPYFCGILLYIRSASCFYCSFPFPILNLCGFQRFLIVILWAALFLIRFNCTGATFPDPLKVSGVALPASQAVDLCAFSPCPLNALPILNLCGFQAFQVPCFAYKSKCLTIEGCYCKA